VAGDEPVAAVDGSTATPWVATDPQATLTVALPQQTNISSATVTRGSTGSFSYTVETSTDGSSWHVVATAPANSTGTDQFNFTSTPAKFVRLDFPGGSAASTPNIDEFAVGGS
jgi:hypothetical protein